MQLNIKLSVQYSMYSPVIPCFLHNRPRDIVHHVMRRFTGDEIDKTDVAENGYKTFTVVSESCANVKHTVEFGNEEKLPHCTCKDWNKHLLPCKHICAVLKHVPGNTWDDLGTMYTSNPVLNIDHDCVGRGGGK